MRAVATGMLDDPAVNGIVINAADVTNVVTASAELAQSEMLLRQAQRIAHVGHWQWHVASGYVDFLAEEMFEIYGITAGEWEGTLDAFIGFVPLEERRALEQAFEEARSTGSMEIEHRIVRPDGSVRYVRKRALASRESSSPVDCIVGTCHDVTEQATAMLALSRAQQLVAGITDTMAEGMVALDTDGLFSFVNAAAERLLGWGAAELLGKPAHEIIHGQGPGGPVHPSEECPIERARRLGEPSRVDRDTFLRRDGTTVPVAYSASPLRGEGIRGAVVVFDDISEHLAEQLRVERELDKLAWVGRIRDALDEGRFVLFAQPIVDLHTRQVVRHELLIRLRTPDGEIVEPDRFLPTAEEFGLIGEIDRWVLGETARLAAQGHHIDVNLSAKSVVDPLVVPFIRDALEAAGAAPQNVVCEITETALLADPAAGEACVRALNELGCRVALDDFGVGYGGFAYLKRFQVSCLKIDREFIRDAKDEVASRHVISAIVSLARAFALETVAEGAEDLAVLPLLEELGVDRVQGFALGRPVPLSEAFR
jgi:PAS domain S-box-containing protein